MTTIEFYDKNSPEPISIDAGNVVKTTFTTNDGQVRYALHTKVNDHILTMFVSKAYWDEIEITPDEKRAI